MGHPPPSYKGNSRELERMAFHTQFSSVGAKHSWQFKKFYSLPLQMVLWIAPFYDYIIADFKTPIVIVLQLLKLYFLFPYMVSYSAILKVMIQIMLRGALNTSFGVSIQNFLKSLSWCFFFAHTFKNWVKNTISFKFCGEIFPFCPSGSTTELCSFRNCVPCTCLSFPSHFSNISIRSSHRRESYTNKPFSTKKTILYRPETHSSRNCFCFK